jgi:tripartite-type tricarboxylate transporter receptor subunit TctC
MLIRAVSGVVLFVALMSHPATAQEPYPTRPVTIVVAFPPGGLADLTARPLATALERIFRQPVIVTNKPGAAGAVGNQFVATSKPDGYTLLMALVSISTLPEVDKLFGRPPNYTIDQFVGIARINAEPSIITARGDGPWKTLRDVVEDAKRRPGQIVHTSSGLYGASHVPFAMFLHAAGITMRHLPTTGGAPMMNALLGGHAEIVASPPALVTPHVPVGKVRLLAHTGVGRISVYPEVPALKELGYEVEYYAWAGLVAPRGVPSHVLKILGDAVRQAIREPEVVTASQKLNTPIAYQDADEFNAWWKKDAETLAGVIRKIGKVEGAN